MRRLVSSLLVATTALAAALSPGAAVFSSAEDCADFSPPNKATVAEHELIVIGTVERVDTVAATLETEAILKGSAQGSTVSLAYPATVGLCGSAALDAGQRVLLFLRVENGVPRWPTVEQAYYLVNERASRTYGTALREQDLIDLITGETDQVVVPAQSADEGEGIEWGSTVLPIAVALGIVFVIGLVLMRIWHRIDPS